MCKHETWTNIGNNEFGAWENCASCQTTRLVPSKNIAELLATYKKEEKIVAKKLKSAEKNTDK